MNNKHSNFLKISFEKLKYLRYSKRTIDIYIHYIEKFLIKTNKYPQHLTSSDFQEYLNSFNFSSTSQQNQIISSIKFLYEKVLNKKYDKVKFDRPRKSETLPNVIPERLLKTSIEYIINEKHKAILSLAYSVGLRSSDILNLKIMDVDSKSMKLKVRNGKGNKDAYLPLYPNILSTLRSYYKKYRPKEYLFEGQKGDKYSGASLNNLIKKYIGKEYHFHNIRHSTATHLLNKGVDISFIQKLLRHNNIKTTLIYLKITTRDLDKLPQLI